MQCPLQPTSSQRCAHIRQQMLLSLFIYLVVFNLWIKIVGITKTFGQEQYNASSFIDLCKYHNSSRAVACANFSKDSCLLFFTVIFLPAKRCIFWFLYSTLFSFTKHCTLHYLCCQMLSSLNCSQAVKCLYIHSVEESFKHLVAERPISLCDILV